MEFVSVYPPSLLNSVASLFALPGSGQLLPGRNIQPQDAKAGVRRRHFSTHRGRGAAMAVPGVPKARSETAANVVFGWRIRRSRPEREVAPCRVRLLSALRVLKLAENV